MMGLSKRLLIWMVALVLLAAVNCERFQVYPGGHGIRCMNVKIDADERVWVTWQGRYDMSVLRSSAPGITGDWLRRDLRTDFTSSLKPALYGAGRCDVTLLDDERWPVLTSVHRGNNGTGSWSRLSVWAPSSSGNDSWADESTEWHESTVRFKYAPNNINGRPVRQGDEAVLWVAGDGRLWSAFIGVYDWRTDGSRASLMVALAPAGPPSAEWAAQPWTVTLISHPETAETPSHVQLVPLADAGPLIFFGETRAAETSQQARVAWCPDVNMECVGPNEWSNWTTAGQLTGHLSNISALSPADMHRWHHRLLIPKLTRDVSVAACLGDDGTLWLFVLRRIGFFQVHVMSCPLDQLFAEDLQWSEEELVDGYIADGGRPDMTARMVDGRPALVYSVMGANQTLELRYAIRSRDPPPPGCSWFNCTRNVIVENILLEGEVDMEVLQGRPLVTYSLRSPIFAIGAGFVAWNSAADGLDDWDVVRTDAPTSAPTDAPTAMPTAAPTTVPTATPSAPPTTVPTAAPSAAPTEAPTAAPSPAPPTVAATAERGNTSTPDLLGWRIGEPTGQTPTPFNATGLVVGLLLGCLVCTVVVVGLVALYRRRTRRAGPRRHRDQRSAPAANGAHNGGSRHQVSMDEMPGRGPRLDGNVDDDGDVLMMMGLPPGAMGDNIVGADYATLRSTAASRRHRHRQPQQPASPSAADAPYAFVTVASEGTLTGGGGGRSNGHSRPTSHQSSFGGSRDYELQRPPKASPRRSPRPGGQSKQRRGAGGSRRPPLVPVGPDTSVLDVVETRFLIPPADLELEARLGEGSYGRVYRGRWRGTVVAVKQVLDRSATAQHHLLVELQTLQAVRPHQNVVQLLGVCLPGDADANQDAETAQQHSPLVVLAYCRLGSLDQLLYGPATHRRSFSEAERLQLAVDSAKGLCHLHLERVVHRDVAARNVLVDEPLQAKITDFGCSRHLEEDDGGGGGDSDPMSSGAAATTKSTVGPIRHMAPEQLAHRMYSRQSDVWAFGMLLYEIFAGEPPWPALSNVEVIVAVSQGRSCAIPPHHAAPPFVRAVAARCCQVRPEDRPNMRQVVRMLEDRTSIVSPRKSGRHNTSTDTDHSTVHWPLGYQLPPPSSTGSSVAGPDGGDDGGVYDVAPQFTRNSRGGRRRRARSAKSNASTGSGSKNSSNSSATTRSSAVQSSASAVYDNVEVALNP